MRRGTTPRHVFNVDVDLSSAVVIYLTYRQNRENVLEKTKEEMTITSTTLEVELSQKDTLAFEDTGTQVSIQIRARFEDGTAIASNIMRASVETILKGGEI